MLSKEKILLAGLAGSGALLLLVTFLVRSRLLHYGSYRQYHAGKSLPIGDVKLGYVLIALIAGLVASVSFVGWELKRDGRRAASR